MKICCLTLQISIATCKVPLRPKIALFNFRKQKKNEENLAQEERTINIIDLLFLGKKLKGI